MSAYNSTFFGKRLTKKHSKRYSCHFESGAHLTTDHLPKCCESLLKFAGIQLPVAVEVHTVENDFQCADSDATLCWMANLNLRLSSRTMTS